MTCTFEAVAALVGFMPNTGVEYTVTREQFRAAVAQYGALQVTKARICATKLKIKYVIK